MRGTRRASRFVLVPVALLLLAACAAGASRSRRVETPDVVFEIHNDLNPPRAITVRLTSQTGGRSVLGSISPGQRRVLRHQEAAYHGQYRLVAEGGSRGEVVSTSFTLFPGARIIWTVQGNLIRIVDGD